MENNNPQISIIVPVYNVKEYLKECLDSLLSQSFKNYEIVLVDDGSTDGSSEMCDSYSEDSKFKIIHKANGGLSDARNRGISESKGKYITFVDSDDVISGDYLEKLYRAAIIEDADIVQGNYTEEYENLGEIDINSKNLILSGNQAFKELLTFKSINVSACAKLYKRELFDDIKFPVGRLNEDNCTTYKLMFTARRVVCISAIIYYYRVHKGSIMHDKLKKEHLDIVKIPKEIKVFLGSKYDEYEEEVMYYRFRIYIGTYNLFIIRTKKMEFLKYKQLLRNRIICINTNNKYISIRYKIYIIILKFSPFIYEKLVKIYRKGEI